MLGLLALSFFVAAVAASIAVFQVVKHAFRVPALLNWPGALCAGAAVLQLTGWLFHDLFAAQIGPQPPAVPWYQWIEFLLLGAWWYIVVVGGIAGYRRVAANGNAATPTKE